MEDNDYDRACRRHAKLAPLRVFAWLSESFTAHLRFVGWEDTRSAALAGRPQGVRDTIARLQELLTGRPWIHLLELQLTPDPDMLGRLLVYLGTSWLELRPDSLPGSRYYLAAVINLTGTASSLPASCEMVLPGEDGTCCILKVRERYLQTEPAWPLLEAMRSGRQGRVLLPWIPLMVADDPVAVRQLWLELWQSEPDEWLRGELLALTRVFAELSKDRDGWRQLLGGLGTMKSAYLEEVRNETRTKVLLKLLRSRFSGQYPLEWETRIQLTSDGDSLERWLDSAATVASVDEFRHACGF